ncbi:MAG: hypothetical protein QOE61_3543, partial [Micromonosporaceae bacterium]|nr:hypothetical protein [Micromonosporaceae bacterium]
MGRSQAYDALMDVCEDVSLDAYLAGRRPLPHLFDLVPPQTLGAEDSDVDAASLAEVVRQQGEPQADVRLLVANAKRYFSAASELANTLRCDVYVPPPDAHVRYVRESSSVAGESWDAVTVDSASGEPTPWLLIRPDERTDAVPTWFISARGRLRQNKGLITVPLPHGIAFATTSTFSDTAALARHVTTGPRAVTTLAITADIGRFEISRFNGASALLDGAEIATLVAASLDLIQPDIQIAMTWPADAEARAALDVELMRFADALNRTVWVPRPPGSVAVLHDRGEFGAVDERGRPSTWYAYVSRLTTHGQPNLGTDAEGRLAPIEQLSATASFPTPSSVAPSSVAASSVAASSVAASSVAASSVAASSVAASSVAAFDPIAEAVRLAEQAAQRPVF